MSLPHLTSDDLNKLRRLVDEGVKVKREVKDLSDSLKETIKAIAEELDIPVKIINKAIQIQFRDNLEEIREDHTKMEEVVEVVRNKNISAT